MKTILLLCDIEPYSVGIYVNNILEDSFILGGKAANALPFIFRDMLSKYDSFDKIIYSAGPGNLTSLKLGYVAAKTFSVVFNIPLYGSTTFNFNNNLPVAAFGKKVFEQNGDTIIIKEGVGNKAFLPNSIENICINYEQTPIYPLPSVI